MSLQHQTKTQQNQSTLKVKKPIEIRDTTQVIKDANDVFEGIGKLKGYQYLIEIDDKVQPVVSRRYSVPPPMQEPLKKNLDWMVDIDVIKKQEEATPWVSNVLCTPKPNGDIRICLNPKPLNKALRRPHQGSRVGAVSERSPPTNVARVRFPDSASYVG